MSVDIYQLYSDAKSVRDFILSQYELYLPLSRSDENKVNLLDDIVSKTEDIKLPRGRSVLSEPISRIKLKGNYSRKLVVQVFEKLDLKVTRYTREYGRTIVHFEEASDSQ